MIDTKPDVIYNEPKINQEKIIHDLKGSPKTDKTKLMLMITSVLVVGAGVLTGYFLFQAKGKVTFLNKNGGSGKLIKSGKMVGSTDKKSFRDVAEGKLERGGIDGEGTHKLIRPGGESQNVYLTSSIVDLEQYVGKKVRVWGETFTAQKAGWLMDVGRIEIL